MGCTSYPFHLGSFDEAKFRSVNVRCETLGIQGWAVIGCDRSVSESAVAPQSSAQNDGLCHYVADMQLHMALQARFMLPNLNSDANSAAALVHQAQADAEKFASRQWR